MRERRARLYNKGRPVAGVLCIGTPPTEVKDMGNAMAGTRTTVTAVTNLAALVEHECNNLLILYRKQENLPEDMESDRLVFVSHPSSQLDTKSKLLSLHTGLDKCYSLLERAIALEEEELDGVETTEYKNTRGRLKGELLNLLKSTEGLLKAAGGKPIKDLDDSEPYHPSNLFHLKLWVYSVLMEVKFWSSTAIALLRELQAVAAKEPSKKSKRSTRSTRR